jgi:hypothetical protein
MEKLLNGVTPIAASTATDQLAAMAQDIGNLIGAIGAAGIDPNGAILICGPREAMILATRLGLFSAVSVLMTLGLPAKKPKTRQRAFLSARPEVALASDGDVFAPFGRGRCCAHETRCKTLAAR